MLAHVLFGAVAAGVPGVARSEDPPAERVRFRSVILDEMAGLVDPDGPGNGSSSSVHNSDTPMK
jgi:hypothetical protein